MYYYQQTEPLYFFFCIQSDWLHKGGLYYTYLHARVNTSLYFLITIAVEGAT